MWPADKWAQNQREGPDARPEAVFARLHGGDHLSDALAAKEAGYRYRRWAEVAAAYLQKVLRRILRDDSVNGGVDVGADREKGGFGDLQAVFILQTGNE